MLREFRKLSSCLALITSFLLFLLLPSTAIPAQDPHTWRLCVRVIDGDTIQLDGKENVRLIGVDTPETKDPRRPVQEFGQEAYEFTRSLAEGKKVRLEYDQTRTDVYRRTLAYVYLEDGTFLNAEIIKHGFGFAYTKYPFKYMEAFRGYERAAREKEIGLWKDDKIPSRELSMTSGHEKTRGGEGCVSR